VQDERLIRKAREKDQILELLRQNGMRVTKQRKLILDIVFEQECTCCKELYYLASKRDKSIGIATVYRMVKVLTDLGVFQVREPYRIFHGSNDSTKGGCRMVLKDQSSVDLSQEEWNQILDAALKKKGYSSEEIEQVILL
jgi:Fur family ferric uptake transcriptional regulator